MKIRLFDRILLTFYTIAIICVSLFMIAGSLRIVSINNLFQEFTMQIESVWQFSVLVIIISLAFLTVSIKLLFSGVKRAKPQSSLLKVTDLGAIRVSINTLDNLAQKAVRSFEEVKDVKTIIVTDIDGIKVQLRIMIMPDVQIPQLTQNIQTKVKEYIESLSGILVKEILIYVDNLSIQQKTRVE